MENETDQIDNEITRIIAMTKSGQLVWEKVPGTHCHYQTTCRTQPRLIISCCKPDYQAEIEGKQLGARPGQLKALCCEIVEQIRRARQQNSDAVKLLRDIR
jgi:hypothetical protein